MKTSIARFNAQITWSNVDGYKWKIPVKNVVWQCNNSKQVDDLWQIIYSNFLEDPSSSYF